MRVGQLVRDTTYRRFKLAIIVSAAQRTDGMQHDRIGVCNWMQNSGRWTKSRVRKVSDLGYLDASKLAATPRWEAVVFAAQRAVRDAGGYVQTEAQAGFNKPLAQAYNVREASL